LDCFLESRSLLLRKIN